MSATAKAYQLWKEPCVNWLTGEALGIDHDFCMNFTHDIAGVNKLCARMNNCMDKIRKSRKK